MRALFVGVAVIAVGCSGETREEVASPSPPPVEPARAAEPAAAKPNLSLGSGLEMRGLVRDGRLALVPIVATAEVSSEPTLTLDEGMKSRKVIVREVRGEWDVGTVRITNRSRMPLLVLRGEIITGAMQDRVIAESQVILAGATEEVSVRCIEQDRDHGSKRFKSGNAMAELTLRRTVAHSDQDAVWKEVEAINERLAIREDTKSYRHAAMQQAKGENQERSTRLAAQLAAHPDRDRMVGVAVAIDGEVLAIDRFASPAVYQSLEGKLLGSYVASDFAGVLEGKKLTPEAVRALAEMSSASATTSTSVDALRPLVEPAKKPNNDPTDPWR